MPLLDASTSSAPRSRRGSVALIAKGLISAVILAALFWKYRGTLPSLRQVEPWSVALAAGLVAVQLVLVGCRWWLLLDMYGSEASVASAVRISWVAFFANQFLPASVGGDAVRIFYARHYSASLGPVIGSVVIDRFIGLLALSILTAGFGAAVADQALRGVIIGFGAAAAAAVIGAIAISRLSGRTLQRRLRRPIVERLLQTAQSLLLILSHPLRALTALAVSLVVQLLSFIALLMIARGLGVEAGVLPFFAIAAILNFVQLMPISIAGWGVREAAAVTAFGLIGVGSGPALLASIVLGLATVAASLPGAALWPYQRAAHRGGTDARARA